MSGDRPHFYGRVVPDRMTREHLESGYFDTHRPSWYNPSVSWWSHGALVVDDQGPGFVDADGVRHPLSLPPWGGKLVYAREYAQAGGKGMFVPSVFVTDEHDHPLFGLPENGFTTEVLRGFAEAAGLTFVEPDTRDSSELKRRYPGFKSPSKSYKHLQRNRADRERSVAGRVRRLLGRSSPEV